jgi:hypothetical protein
MDLVVFSALIWKIVDWIRELRNLPYSRSSVLTQLVAWLVGIGAVILASHAGVSEGLVLPGTDAALGVLDWPSQVLVGVLVASTASAGVDLKQAIDRSDSAAKPALVPGATTAVMPGPVAEPVARPR